MAHQSQAIQMLARQRNAALAGQLHQSKLMRGRDPAVATPVMDRRRRDPRLAGQLLDEGLHAPTVAELASKSRGMPLAIHGMAGTEAACDQFAMAAKARKSIPGTTEMQLGFARRVLIARLAAGYETQDALGKAMGMKGSSVSNWERGLQMCHPTDMYRLAKLLGVTTDWLIAGDENFLTVAARRRLREELGHNHT